jgi:pimeloyl-ACP methyl ester carboxylesterase
MALTFPLGICQNSLQTPPEAQTITILVHGFIHNRSAWLYIQHCLKREPSAGTLVTINLGHPFQDIESYSRKLAKRIAEIRAVLPTAFLNINLIGHSMGGIVCSYYAMNGQLPISMAIRKVITIGSPLQGTPLAKLAQAWSPAALQMRIDSHFLAALQEQVANLPANQEPLFYHIGLRGDLIVPESRSYFPSRELHRVIQCGHVSALYSPAVCRCLIQWLRD